MSAAPDMIDGDIAAALPDHDADDLPALTASRRADGWTAERQRKFLELIAEGATAKFAAYMVDLTAQAAYSFRRTAAGAAFNLGWRAATLVGRDVVADKMMTRAFEGQEETITRDDGSTITRHRIDNRLGLALLARLDRQADALASDPDARAARLVAQEFDAFLSMIEADGGPARAGLFLARRGEGQPADLAPIHALAAAERLVTTGVARADEVDVSDLDPTSRADWTADQWRRAEAAGLLALALPHEPDEPERTPQPSQESQDTRDDPIDRIWWDDDRQCWITDFPPPEDFDGFEDAEYGLPSYVRSLSDEEQAQYMAGPLRDIALRRERDIVERDLLFAELEMEGLEVH